MKHQQANIRNIKSKRIIFTVISIILVSILVALLLEARSRPLSTEEFILRMEEAGFGIEDRTYLFEQLETYLVAEHESFYIEFMVHETTSDARSSFNQIRSELENLAEVVAFFWNSSGFSSSYTQITSDGQYASMRRVRNTIIFINTTTDYENDVAEVWNLLVP